MTEWIKKISVSHLFPFLFFLSTEYMYLVFEKLFQCLHSQFFSFLFRSITKILSHHHYSKFNVTLINWLWVNIEKRKIITSNYKNRIYFMKQARERERESLFISHCGLSYHDHEYDTFPYFSFRFVFSLPHSIFFFNDFGVNMDFFHRSKFWCWKKIQSKWTFPLA